MLITELIEKKMNGFEHTAEEIKQIIDGLLTGRVEDYQMTAWMMAVCCRGMTSAETAELTLAMMESGDTVDLSDIPGVKVDKHSTGGVGDTTTLIAAPLVAACGGTVAKMSGRGLAHSGGTLDKLESVPGVCVEQPLERFKAIVRDVGVCVTGQSKALVPADRKMYALRDVSGTVRSIPLIASSVMSKKLASGADAIVLDVKAGSGAFMDSPERARTLAREMVNIGKNLGRNTIAIISNMDAPLGMAVGNGLEMREAIQALGNAIPREDPLMQVSLALAANMLRASGLAENDDEAYERLDGALLSGEGLLRLKAMLSALGGDLRCVDEPDMLVRTRRVLPICARCEGYINRINAADVGMASLMLGAGRERLTDVIDPAVGILFTKRCGDAVRAGETFAYMYVNDETRLKEAEEKLVGAVTVTETAPKPGKLIYDTVM